MNPDVLVVGGGNAGLCAALAAREAGASVLLVECAPRHMRGGNSRHTRDVRFLHHGPSRYVTGPYLEDEFWDDLIHVTGGQTTPELARQVIRESVEIPEWMHSHGVLWQPPLSGTLHLARTNGFFLGGGKAMVNAYYSAAAQRGIEILYETSGEALRLRDDGVDLHIRGADGSARTLSARAIVVAAGGFEANVEWLRRYWGDAADNYVIRGTPYNRGAMLSALYDAGAAAIGDPCEFHAVAVDARAPKFDGGIVTRLDSVPFGIAVNRHGQRFYDEGEDFWPKRYAIWGGLIARQPDQIAYSIIDADAMGRFMPSVFPPFEASSVQELAGVSGLDPERLQSTVDEFNAAVVPAKFDPAVLDECATTGIHPPKTHWARRIERPPFYAYPLRPGITFTYMGVPVDARARVLSESGEPLPGVFAAGEVMAGTILGRGYLAGFGLTVGTVFGRTAGSEAVRYARA